MSVPSDMIEFKQDDVKKVLRRWLIDFPSSLDNSYKGVMFPTFSASVICSMIRYTEWKNDDVLGRLMETKVLQTITEIILNDSYNLNVSFFSFACYLSLFPRLPNKDGHNLERRKLSCYRYLIGKLQRRIMNLIAPCISKGDINELLNELDIIFLSVNKFTEFEQISTIFMDLFYVVCAIGIRHLRYARGTKSHNDNLIKVNIEALEAWCSGKFPEQNIFLEPMQPLIDVVKSGKELVEEDDLDDKKIFSLEVEEAKREWCEKGLKVGECG